MFFIGFIVGFLACSWLAAKMLERHNLFDGKGGIVYFESRLTPLGADPAITPDDAGQERAAGLLKPGR